MKMKLLYVITIFIYIPSGTKSVMRPRNYLQGTEGEVSAGNFTYYNVTFQGPLTILLTTIEGDADLYVSHRQIPTWEPHTYSLKSTTSGVDVVYASAALARPLVVGVYGHPSSPRSRYALHLFCLHQSLDGALVQVADGNSEDVEAEDGVAICRNLPLLPCPNGEEGVTCKKRRKNHDVKTETAKPPEEYNALALFWTMALELLGDIITAMLC